MSPLKTTLLLTASAGGFVVSTVAYARAEGAPASGAVQPPPPAMMWTDPPETVRVAAAALRSACADWQQERPLPANPSAAEAAHLRPAEVTVCEAARDPDEMRTMQVAAYAVLAVACLGVAAASFVTVMSLVRLLGSGIGRVAAASWAAWPSNKRSL